LHEYSAHLEDIDIEITHEEKPVYFKEDDRQEASDITEENLAVTQITTVRIHPDMPEFSITRLIGDYINDVEDWIPAAREITLIVSDESGNVIQTIAGITQSNIFENIFFDEPTFDDYNFDGYLDMRLHRYNPGAGGMLSEYYFWLWDSELGEFVLNWQLIYMGRAAYFSANHDRQQLLSWNRWSAGSEQFWSYYEYIGNGDFKLVMTEELSFKVDYDHWLVTITDVLSGEVVIKIMEEQNGF